MPENSIDRIILFGGTRALFNLAKEVRKRSLELFVITEQMHLGERINEHGTLRENLEREGIEYFEEERLHTPALIESVTPRTLGISISAVWIFKKNTIDLFDGRLVNIHGALLPKGRGGGGYSWRILCHDRLGGFSIHRLEEGIDTGDILAQKEFEFPLTCKTPQDYYDIAQVIQDELLRNFLDSVISGDQLKPIPQNEYFGTYWPRINSTINGYINWDWSVDEIESFIDAFDDPYPGASTFVNERKVHLKKCFKSDDQGYFHPFQYGIVFRIVNGLFFVASKQGCLVVKEVLDDSGNDVSNEVRIGDRFYTPYSYLERAKTGRIVYTSKGLKNGA